MYHFTLFMFLILFFIIISLFNPTANANAIEKVNLDERYSVIETASISHRTQKDKYDESVLDDSKYYNTVGNIYLTKINHQKSNGWSVRADDIAKPIDRNAQEKYQVYQSQYEINLYTKSY